MAQHNENVVVLLYAGSAVDVSSFIDKVKAVVYVGICGEGANEACAHILTGKVCPSGKLAETFPCALADCPVHKENEYEIANYYAERLMIGYRYYDTKRVSPQFPFGFGLSYAKFAYSDLSATKKDECTYEISYTVTNVSNVAGKEVSQVYVRDVLSTSERPEKELKAFAKTELAPHAHKRVTHVLTKEAFAFFNASLNDWYVENGKFEILVGGSSRDLPLKAEIKIQLSKFEQYSPTNLRGL